MEIIDIKEVIDRGIDNSGGEERILREEDIIQILKDPESWTDDLTFVDYSNRTYSIDDLINKKVQVGGETFVVIEDESTRQIMEEIHALIDPVLQLKETLKDLVAKYPDDIELGRSVRRLNLDS